MSTPVVVPPIVSRFAAALSLEHVLGLPSHCGLVAVWMKNQPSTPSNARFVAGSLGFGTTDPFFEYGGRDWASVARFRKPDGWDAHLWIEADGIVLDIYGGLMSTVSSLHRKRVDIPFPLVIERQTYSALAQQGLSYVPAPAAIQSQLVQGILQTQAEGLSVLPFDVGLEALKDLSELLCSAAAIGEHAPEVPRPAATTEPAIRVLLIPVNGAPSYRVVHAQADLAVLLASNVVGLISWGSGAATFKLHYDKYARSANKAVNQNLATLPGAPRMQGALVLTLFVSRQTTQRGRALSEHAMVSLEELSDVPVSEWKSYFADCLWGVRETNPNTRIAPNTRRARQL